jgi:cell wall-associated NlpC family hydrolase
MPDLSLFDRRTTPARPDLAAERLRGVVQATRYSEAQPMRVAVPLAPMTARPDAAAPLDTQLLCGEMMDVYETGAGWAWGQAVADGYVGYVPLDALAEPGGRPTHRVTIGLALVYPAPTVRSRPVLTLPMGAQVRVTAPGLAFTEIEGGFVPTPHLCPVESRAQDWVAVAQMLLGAPYLWGGRSAGGIDCSGLVQLARQAAGLPCPRDSDMQQAAPGEDVAEGALQRGDLVFWKGHVGVMLGPTQVLHANGHHMAVAVEPLHRAVGRIERNGGGPVTVRRRWLPPL